MKPLAHFVLFAFFTGFVFADLPVAPYAKAAISLNGVYVFISVPTTTLEKGVVLAKNTMYELVADGNLKEIWHIDGQYSLETYISDDGIHYVQIDNPVFGHHPIIADVALRFYSKGKLINSYSTLQLLKDKSRVKESISHYDWLKRDTPGYAYILDDQFILTTIDGTKHIFDLSTGGKVKSDQNSGKH